MDVNVGDIKIITGNLNAKVGHNNEHREKLMRDHEFRKKNEHEIFADLCMNHDLVIGGTMFQHRNIHKVK